MYDVWESGGWNGGTLDAGMQRYESARTKMLVMAEEIGVEWRNGVR